MARDKNGWIKLHSSILDKDFTPIEFKIWCGLLLLANSLKHKDSGLVDLSLREIASRLGVSTGALQAARKQFVADERIVIVSLPNKTKPIMAIKIINFDYYQGKENVSQNEHSRGGSSIYDTKKVQSMTRKVSPNEQSVPWIEQSRIQNDSTKKHKETKEYYYRNRRNGDGKHKRNPRAIPRAHEYKQPHEYV